MLKRWKWGSLALILALACFSLKSLKGITQEWRKGSERALFGLGLSSARQSGKRRRLKGYGGGIYSLQPKNSRWAKGYPETPGNPDFSARKQHPDTPGNGVRSIRPYPRSNRVRQGKTSVFALLSCFVAHKCLYRFSWALDLNRNLWTKSLLIVQRSYTQISNLKSNLSSKLELRFFISFLRVVYRHLIHLYIFTTCTHAQLHD